MCGCCFAPCMRFRRVMIPREDTVFGLRRWSDTQDGAGLELSASDLAISAIRPTSESGPPSRGRLVRCRCSLFLPWFPPQQRLLYYTTLSVKPLRVDTSGLHINTESPRRHAMARPGSEGPRLLRLAMRHSPVKTDQRELYRYGVRAFRPDCSILVQKQICPR